MPVSTVSLLVIESVRHSSLVHIVQDSIAHYCRASQSDKWFDELRSKVSVLLVIMALRLVWHCVDVLCDRIESSIRAEHPFNV